MEEKVMMLLSASLLTGMIFMLAGIILRIRPPQKINMLYGYRTPRSMKNQDTWQEANQFSSGLLIKVGIVFSIIMAPLSFVLQEKPGFWAAGIVFGCLSVAAYAIISTEKRLKKLFDKEGNRIS